MQPERRPLVVAAELEPAPLGDRLLVALDVHLLDHPAELANPLDGRLQVVHPEEQVRRRPLVPAVHPAGNRPRPDREPLPGRPGLEPSAEQPLVERPSSFGVLHTQFEERHLTSHPLSLSRRCGRTKSDLIREAVDRFLDTPLTKEELLAQFRAAADAAFGIAPYLEDGATYVRKLRDLDRRRAERLEQQWHGGLADSEPSAQ